MKMAHYWTVGSYKEKCDVCLAPATHGVRDIRRVEDSFSNINRYEPVGEPRWGCELHPVFLEGII